MWIPAVEKTGGKFYAASSEDALLAAIEDIDNVATGTIQVKQYSSQQPRFAIFAMIALGFWTSAHRAQARGSALPEADVGDAQSKESSR